MSSVNKILLWILKCYFMSYTVMYSFVEFESLKIWRVLPLPKWRFLTTALRYIDKDNFECPELGVVQKCPMILSEYQSPGGKFFWKQNFEKMPIEVKKRCFLAFCQHWILIIVLIILKNTTNAWLWLKFTHFYLKQQVT